MSHCSPSACIDVFCHCLPAAYGDAVKQSLKRPLQMFERAMAMPVMVDPGARLRMMDQFPGYQQILSLASPTIESMAEPADAPLLARIGNEALAGMANDHPDRFPGWVAALPMNHPTAAIEEAEMAVQQLGASGVQLYTNVLGKPLDRPEYWQVIEAIARLGCPIWLHPIRPMTAADYSDEEVSKFDLWWALGWPHETSLAMCRLVFAGIFDRWPNLKIITHHCGGVIPMVAGRMESGMELLGTRNPPQWAKAVETSLSEPPARALRRFYADTASFGSRAAIQCAIDFFGCEQMLFATDSPFDPEQGPGYIRQTLRAIDQLSITPDQRQAILIGNATRLLSLAENTQ